MANVTKTVKSSGGDYTSLNAALAGQSADLTANCGGTGGAGILTIECYAMQDTTAASTGTGYTTSASYYINITVPTAERHDGKWNTSKYRHENTSSNSHSIYVWEDFVRISWLQFKINTASNNNAIIFRGLGSSSRVYVFGCIFDGDLDADGDSAIYHFNIANGGICYAYNNIIYDFASGAGIKTATGTPTLYSYNNTIYGCSYGLQNSDGTIVAKNTICNSCTDNYNGTITTSYCCSDAVGELSGTGDRNGTNGDVTFVNTTDGSQDFHLGATDTAAIDLGVSDPGSGLFSDDIDGTTRSGSWDIGADEYVAAGGSTIWKSQRRKFQHLVVR